MRVIPVALMEALAYRIPAISTETGGIPELLGDGAGILVKPADSAALADAMEEAMTNPVRRALLSDAGFMRVSAKFNLETVADQLVALMEGLLEWRFTEAGRDGDGTPRLGVVDWKGGRSCVP